MTVRGHVVVGVARNPAGASALRWTAAIAAAQNWEVVAVHVVDASLRTDLPLEADQAAAVRDSSDRAQQWVQDVIGAGAGPCAWRFKSRVGKVEAILAREARAARLLVIGQPQLASHRDLPSRLRRRCGCPVIVIDEHGAADERLFPVRGRAFPVDVADR